MKMLQHGACMRCFQQWRGAAACKTASKARSAQASQHMRRWSKRHLVAAWRSVSAKHTEHQAIISVCVKLMRSRTLHGAYQAWRQWTIDSKAARSKVGPAPAEMECCATQLLYVHQLL